MLPVTYIEARDKDIEGVTVFILKGKILRSITVNEEQDQIHFFTTDDEVYMMFHNQDCCEDVTIEDICGDLEDLIGSPILEAEEVISFENPEDVTKGYQDISYTWTFYKFGTMKGCVTIRWYGESNGYYSERVDFKKV